MKTIRSSVFLLVLAAMAPAVAMASTPALRPAPLADDSKTLGPYAYDATGSIRSIGNDQYTYDSAGRLVRATVSGVHQGYGYDAFGNRSPAAGPATYDCVNGNLAVSCLQTYETSATSNRLTSSAGRRRRTTRLVT